MSTSRKDRVARIGLAKLKQDLALAANQVCVDHGFPDLVVDINFDRPSPRRVEIMITTVDPEHFAIAHGRKWENN